MAPYAILLSVATAAGIAFAPWMTASPARADSEPVIVIPGKLGVPVIIDGIDATAAVVYGDWGLSRPGHGSIIIEGGAPAVRLPPRLPYFPATGQPPTYGRDEIPTRPRSTSKDFHRSWSAGSDHLPADLPSFTPPTVIVAPTVEPRYEQRRREPGHR